MRPSESQESANSQLSCAQASRMSSVKATGVEDILSSSQPIDRADHLVLGSGEDLGEISRITFSIRAQASPPIAIGKVRPVFSRTAVTCRRSAAA